jgi:hypothetical protein
VPEREQRLAANEAYFREVNERVQEHVKDVAGAHARFNMLCECSSLACAERIPVTAAEYEEAHRNPRQFIVTVGHVQFEIEESVLRTDRFEVVRKHSDAGEVAARAADAAQREHP